MVSNFTQYCEQNNSRRLLEVGRRKAKESSGSVFLKKTGP
jgi:hypothetical protein